MIGVLPAITGKVELVYEGEQEGPGIVAQNLVGKAVRKQFISYFPDPEQIRKNKEGKNPYKPITDWFEKGNMIDVLHDYSASDYDKELSQIPGLLDLVIDQHGKQSKEFTLFLMEFALHGLAEYSMLSRHKLERGMQFKDLLSSMFSMPGEDEEEEDY